MVIILKITDHSTFVKADLHSANESHATVAIRYLRLVIKYLIYYLTRSSSFSKITDWRI